MSLGVHFSDAFAVEIYFARLRPLNPIPGSLPVHPLGSLSAFPRLRSNPESTRTMLMHWSTGHTSETKIAAHAFGSSTRGIRSIGVMYGPCVHWRLRAPCASRCHGNRFATTRFILRRSGCNSTCPFTGRLHDRDGCIGARIQQAMWQRSQPMHFDSSMRATNLVVEIECFHSVTRLSDRRENLHAVELLGAHPAFQTLGHISTMR